MISKLDEVLRDFLNRIPLHSPFRVGQSIVFEVGERRIEVTKREKGLQIKKTTSDENQLIIKFSDLESFQLLFGSKDLEAYGNHLVTLATQKKIFLDLGPYEDPMKSGFHRFVGYLKKEKGIETFRYIIPTF